MSEDQQQQETSRKWMVLRRALIPLACLLLAGNAVTTPILFAFNARRARDIERLVCSAHQDKVNRVANTSAYLETPLGHQTTGPTGGLNTYIRRVSLPQLKLEVAKEREHLPDSCGGES